ncbi:MAG TPA: 16S rRNA (cytidine(1402)-2'-O)-methyltransferase [Chthonomonadales bacterium]|nr:16S rRNA (cytidine(1402)-2'-O)-methyltransferase [Chthonomonadales bacterium]
MPGILYVVATPIGNLEDITLRALRVLKEVDLIAAEDTRITRKLLSHYGIHTPLTSCHRHTREAKITTLAARLAAGENIALVCDAGTPAISDPGADLIARAIAQGSPVVAIPGPSAVLAALVSSGLPTGRFTFEGFPPRTKSDRRAFFAHLRNEARTVVLFESPGRLLQTLEDIYAVLGDRPISVARELTKQFEEVYRGTVSGAIAHYRSNKPRGEFTLVLGPEHSTAPEDTSSGPTSLQQALQAALEAGATPRDAVAHVADGLGLPRRLVYRTLLELQNKAR